MNGMVAIAVSDLSWFAIIFIILAIIAKEYYDSRRAANVAARLVDTDAKFEKAMREIAMVGKLTHMLVNSAMGTQLKLHAETARAKADITGDRTDIATAETAERLLADHVRKQERVDATQE